LALNARRKVGISHPASNSDLGGSLCYPDRGRGKGVVRKRGEILTGGKSMVEGGAFSELRKWVKKKKPGAGQGVGSRQVKQVSYYHLRPKWEIKVFPF